MSAKHFTHLSVETIICLFYPDLHLKMARDPRERPKAERVHKIDARLEYWLKMLAE